MVVDVTRTVVLLGAGASVDAGIPTAVQLTRCIVDAFEDRYKYRFLPALNFVVGGLYFRRGMRAQSPFDGVNIEELASALKALAHRDEAEMAPFVGSWRHLVDELEQSFLQSDYDYGDLSWSLEQLKSDDQEPEQSAELLRDAAKSLHRLLQRREELRRGGLFAWISRSVLVELRKQVWLSPGDGVDKVYYLHPLVRAARSNPLSIATLNYDNTIELAREGTGVPCSTGVDEWVSRGRFRMPEHGIELLKLHGSMNWRVHEEESTPGTNQAKKRRRFRALGVAESLKDQSEPAIIFGEGNKLTAWGPFLDLFMTFKRRLEEAVHLVVIGYSFRDDHVNEAISTWIEQSKDKQLTVIDAPEADSFAVPEALQMGQRFKFMPTGGKAGIAQLFADR